MTLNNKMWVLLLGLLGLGSCSKDYFDPDYTGSIPQSRLDRYKEDPVVRPNLAQASLASAYSFIYQTGRSESAAGFKDTHIFTDLMGTDATIRIRYWFHWDYYLDNFEADYRRTDAIWSDHYYLISICNKVLEEYAAEHGSNTRLNEIRAQALGIRALAYFYLINFYQTTYVGSENKLGVPLVLTSSEEKLPRSTVREVYNQIIEDLTYSVENGVETSSHDDFDRYVAAAYLAKVYASMEDWDNTLKYARIAKEGASDLVSTPYRSWELSMPDILWGYDVRASTSMLWWSFASHVDAMQGASGYASRAGARKLISSTLYDLIPNTDSRKKLFLHEQDNPSILQEARKINPGLGNYDQVKIARTPAGLVGDNPYIRVQDPILLEIEALVELNRLNEASTALSAFVQQRDPSFVAPTTQDGLREAVRLQRRIELWLEGTHWFDLRRWKAVVNRPESSNHYLKLTKDTNSSEYIFKIPQREMDLNDKLVQNP